MSDANSYVCYQSMTSANSKKNYFITNIGVISLLIFVIAIEGIIVVQNWTYTAYATSIAVFAAIVLLIIIKGAGVRKSDVPTNVQLQDIPPAIVEIYKND